MGKNYIVLDIGGTAVKYALGDREGRLWNKGSIPTLPDKGAEDLVNRLAELINKLRNDDTAGAAISTAGVVDPEFGIILQSSNIPGYSGYWLTEHIQEKTGLYSTVENDVNCMALGELWKGSDTAVSMKMGDAKVSPLVYVAVGTGIGGAVVNEGRIISGASCCGGEIGFFPMGDGKTLEDIASVGALLRRLEKAKGMEKGSLSGEKVFEMLKAGDSEVEEALQCMIEGLARGIAYITCILDPAYIVLGGAMLTSHMGYFLPRIKKAWRSYLPTGDFAGMGHLPTAKGLFKRTQLLVSFLGNNAQLLGALKNHIIREEVLEADKCRQ